ncbi:MAG TPA: UDP-N-acetylmuramoyl-L-alanyl-D-glutamate--2,6-diaminopimelate ligase [bacterium]|nr:UDP-N-acetylmuramoyl-L-alanyl-D-glutamate--2,6-diaminopimelate ligase [bacterium]
MRLANLLAALPVSPPGDGPVVLGSRDREVTGLAYHSAHVRAGDLFAAIRGLSQDGHRYAQDAARRGAVAVLVDHAVPDVGATQVVVPDTRQALAFVAAAFHGTPSEHLWVCGVTGTNGKTTTTYLLEAILARAGRRVGLVGTLGARLGGAPVEFHATTPTTPEAPDVQRLLAEMRAAGAGDVIMEVTSHALALHRVDACRFGAAVFTNLTQDHLDFHGDLAGYRDAKARLFEMVAPDGLSVVNADDEASAAMASRSRARVWTYGIEQRADVCAERLTLGPRGTRGSVVWPGGRMPLVLPLPGRFNVANALAAAAVALARGIPPEVVSGALETVPGVPGRCELVNEGQPFTVIVDYAHTPDGLEKVLRLAREVATGRCVTVFGCGGDRDRTKRPIMGRIGTALADYAVFTSDNPRSEDPGAIIREIEAGAAGRNFESEPDRRLAIGRALALARAGDVVVIAGKGHEPYQILRDRTIAFDDREVARDLLRAGRTELGAHP